LPDYIPPKLQDRADYGRERLRLVYGTLYDQTELAKRDRLTKERGPEVVAMMAEIERLDRKLIVDFLEASREGRFVATGFRNGLEGPLDLVELLGYPQFKLRLDQEMIESPGGPIWRVKIRKVDEIGTKKTLAGFSQVDQNPKWPQGGGTAVHPGGRSRIHQPAVKL
jgi:hypothetical protein